MSTLDEDTIELIKEIIDVEKGEKRQKIRRTKS